MSILIVDDILRAKLENLKGPVQLCDHTGKVLGVVNPVIDPEEYDFSPPEMSKEELERMLDPNQKTYTTAEVLAYLEKLP